MKTPMSGQRAWEEEVLHLLVAHVETEGEVLADYASAVEKADASDIRYLFDLILDDERRHHRVYQEMARALRGLQEWRHFGPQVPDMSGRGLSAELRTLTLRLLAVERQDRRELKELRRKLQPVADTTLWALLVDLMQLDTEKHERILGFIVEHADS